MRKIAFSLLSAVILVAMALPAGSGAVLAQPSSWPDDANWTRPTDCYFDPPEDEHPDWVDIVGNETIGPAAYYYFGTDYAFFRERVIGDPSGPGNFSQSVWLVLFDLPEPGDYEYLLSMDGKDEKVQLWNNTVQESLVWDPILKDEAEQLLQEYPAGAYARIVADGTGHWFVDWAFPLSVLGSYNITANTTMYFCTSADANNYNKDYLDCYEPDLAITEKSEAWVSLVNKTYNVSYTVCNEGAAALAGASNTTITIDGVGVLEDPVHELTAGECYNSTVGPFTMSGTNDTIMVCADNGDVVGESNEDNNCMNNTFIFACELPEADFSANNTNPCVNTLVLFTDSSTGQSDSWSWDFGDGSNSTDQNPTHQYSSAGIYNVSLTVENACGNDTETKTNYITVQVAPVADFSIDDNSTCVNTSVNFTDLSTPTGEIDSWSWDFGDGNTSSVQNPSHQYSSAGTYNVSLNVTNECGSNITTKTNYITVQAAIDGYNLTISSTSGGSVTTPGEGTYSYNASEVVDLVATPDANYHFVNWTGNVGTMGDANSATTNITMDGNYSIVANFAIDRYNLTVSSTSGGSVTTPGEGVSTYDAGTVVDLDATADADYHFVNWTGDIGTMGDANSATTNITMDGDYSIVGNFAIDRYNLTVSSTSGGNVTTPGEGVSTYDAGTVVDLDATPDANYHFVNWTGNVGTMGDANSATTNITMDGNYSIVAKFAIDRYDLTISSTSGGNVTTPGEGVSTHDAGTVVDLVATPDANYHFVNWTGNVGTMGDANSATTNITMDGDYSIVANFAIDRYDLSISSTSGGNVTTPGEGVSTHDAGTVVDLVATPDANYHFVNWTGNVGTMGDANSATTNITMDGNYSIVANFEELPPETYNLTISSSSGGNVTTPGEGVSTYDAGTVVDLDATPDANYHFVNWTGNVGTMGDANSAMTNITMDGDYSIVGNFAIDRYNLTISSTSGGNVTTPGEGVSTHDAGTVVDLVATPDANYHFVNWTGNVGTMGDANSATTNITMDGNYSIVAKFAIDRYDLTVSSTSGGNVTVNGATPPDYPNTTTWNCSENVTLNAVAAGWYRFVNWSGDLSGNTTPRNITMYDNYTITANFINIATLEGNVTFVERGSAPDAKWIEPFVVKGFEAGNLSNELWSENTTTNNTGFFTITGLTPGTYDIGIKNCTCLSEVETGKTLNPGTITYVDFGEIREGDIVESDKVDGFDVSKLGMAYGANPGDGNWNPNADLNRSGKVDGFDVSLLGMYYGEKGDAKGYF